MNDKCVKCGEEIYESGSISRCLGCGKATAKEIHGEDYFKAKNNIISKEKQSELV